MLHPHASFRDAATLIAAVSIVAMSSMALASAPATFPDAETSDPAKLGSMVGWSSPADRTVRFEDGIYFQFPAMRRCASTAFDALAEFLNRKEHP